MRLSKLILASALLFCLTTMQAQKYVGGDISLLPTYEEHGAKYMDKNGQTISNLLDFLKEQGLNAMRVRLFVDPSLASDEAKGQGVRQDLEYVKTLGKRIKDAGMQFILPLFRHVGRPRQPKHTPAFHQRQHTRHRLHLPIHQGLSDSHGGSRGNARLHTDWQ